MTLNETFGGSWAADQEFFLVETPLGVRKIGLGCTEGLQGSARGAERVSSMGPCGLFTRTEPACRAPALALPLISTCSARQQGLDQACFSDSCQQMQGC